MSTYDHSSTYHDDRDPALASVTEDTHTIMVNHISWGAIFAGVVVALVVQVLLTMLGVGIGVATLDPGSGDNPAGSTFSIVAGIWYVVSGIIAAFAGGYVAARTSGQATPSTGAYHGLTAWAFTTLLVLYMLSTAVGSIVGGALGGVANAVGGATQTVSQAAGPMLSNVNPLDMLERQVRATGTNPEALDAAAVNALYTLVMSDPENAGQARQEAAEALAQARNIPINQAEQQVIQLEQQYRQTMDNAQATATDVADTTATAVSTGALVAFVALVLGAIAGWFGGRSGVVHPVLADRLVPSRRGM